MPKGGFLGKVDKEFKKGRNDHDAQVEKCKEQIDRINKLVGSKIFIYDRETAYVALYILEARNNPAQYNSLVSNLNASTKNELDVNIKKHNITVPTQQASQEELVEKALVEAEHCTKIHDITAGFKDHCSKLNPDGVVLFINTSKQSGINVDGCVGTALLDNALNIKYPATWNGISTQKFFVENGITNPYASFDSKIEPSTQSEVQKEAHNSSEMSNTSKVSTAEEDSDDDIEIISKLLEPEVMLTNGKKIEVKKIIDAIYKPKDLDFYLKKLTPETNQLVKKEIALKLAYDLYNDSKELSEVSSISEALGINEEFNNYSDFNLAELKDEEVNITGGEYSYL